jgi:tetraacyldisaccharide 4'-kinase
MKILKKLLSIVYRIIVFVRNFFYDKGILKIKFLDSKVISVGNLSAGGTGKTTLVEFICAYIIENNRFPVIISKGYKRQHDDIKVVETSFRNDNNELCTENFGDEPFMMLENLSVYNGKCLVVVGDNKTKAAKLASSKFKPDVIIIDDGFQHRKLSRDLDILILNPGDKSNLLPAGKLREPMGNMKRADLIIINNKFNKPGIIENTRHKPTVTVRYKLLGFMNKSGDMLDSEVKKATAFCGIADPSSFHDLLINNRINPVKFREFPDHHNFEADDIEQIIKDFTESDSEIILTTQKDYVRLKNSELVLKSKSGNIYKQLLFEYPLYYSKIKIEISSGEDILWKKINLVTGI